jgi:hypothetical protein
MVLEPDVCPVWARNVQAVPPLVGAWWGYPNRAPELRPHAAPGTPRRGTALCFTAGVDSFYSLLRGLHPVDALVFAAGYDVRLADAPRRKRVEAKVRAVGAELGLRVITVATNLRSVEPVRSVPWARSHGGALVALGHLLTDEVGQLVVSSSYPREYNQPWGSRWDLDPCHSSSRLQIAHVGADQWRYLKVRSIAGERVVQRHLRVCWEHQNDDLNCCACEKCVRSMLAFEAAGHLDDCVAFPRRHALAHAIDRLAPLEGPIIRSYEILVEQDLRQAVKSAVRRLLARSYAWKPPWRKRLRAWWRALRRRR